MALALSFHISAFANSYSTGFPAAENPISEGSNWLNGMAIGLSWKNVRTTAGFAFGTQTGMTKYDDSIASLAGAWGPNQTVQATVRVLRADSAVFEEVELHVRRSITTNRATGYEILFSVKPKNPYIQIVRWDGAYNDWTRLKEVKGHVKDGDVIKASIVGSKIEAYVNGALVLSVSDGTYGEGNPGIGFYLESGKSADSSNFGFAKFTASDEME